MTQEEDSIPFPLHLRVFLFPSLQNYEQSCSLPLLNYEQSYSSSVQIYDQGVHLFQENLLILLIGGSILKSIKEEILVFAPSFTSFWVICTEAPLFV